MTSSGTGILHENSPSSLSAVVRIAYHQSSIICGMHDRTVRNCIAAATARDDDAAVESCTRMKCTRRLLGLPVFVSVTSAVRNGYITVRDSHESVTSVFNQVENGIRAGLDYVAPVNEKVADALQGPLKVADSVVCIGLDFVEERMPSVKLPPDQIYKNVKDSIRNIFTSTLEIITIICGEKKNKVNDAPACETTQEETAKRK